jgi:predicted amidohydrolase
MKVYGIQLQSEWENKDENFRRVDTLLENYKIEKNSLLVLPEMFATGFCLETDKTLLNEPQKTENYLYNLSKDKECWVIAGMTQPSEQKGKAYNCAVTFTPNGEKALCTPKIHTIPILGEDKVHIKGSTVENIQLNSFMVTPLICYDLRFSEPFRLAITKGTDVFITIACWPQSRIEHWRTLLQARAIENQSYVIGVNSVGREPNMKYGGRSLIIDPTGKVVADGGEVESVIEGVIDKKIIDSWRKEFPAIKDIRTDLS